MKWEFWIDVGGTFTDCVARRPDGMILSHKLLSSGAYKGVAGEIGSARSFRDESLRGVAAGFFEGFGCVVGGERAVVRRFDADRGEIELDAPIVAPRGGGKLDGSAEGVTYELSCGLEAPVVGIRRLMGLRLEEPIGTVEVRLGTTRGTNALLEREGATTAFVTTAGHGDVLRIGYQDRPRLFELNIRKPVELFRETVEIEERIGADGRVLRPLDERAAARRLSALRDEGIEAVAICLMNSYRNPVHEIRVEELARAAGIETVRSSWRVSPLQRIVPRGETTVVDAYLSPVIRGYVETLRKAMPEARVRMMTSAGGLTEAESFAARDSVLSGPAGGVVACARIAEEIGAAAVIGFDMGGTSTDVCRYEGAFERRGEMRVRDAGRRTDVRVVAPMLWVETVAAGGGTVCDFDGVKPIVGPRSAGSRPGPACYGGGGPLCLTDCNLLLGRMLEEDFPFPLKKGASERRMDELIERIAGASGKRYERDELAAGLIEIADEHMADAIRRVSIARGHDVRGDVLIAYGGAGGQHACAVAERLGIGRIVVHARAGLLSAWGIGQAEVSRHEERDVGRAFDAETAKEIAASFVEMEAELGRRVMADAGVGAGGLRSARSLEMRYAGQETTLTVAEPADGGYGSAFEALHRRQYGFDFAGRAIEVRSMRVVVSSKSGGGDRETMAHSAGVGSGPARRVRTYFGGERMETAVHERSAMRCGVSVGGPALIVEPNGVIVVAPGWSAARTEADYVELRRLEEGGAKREARDRHDGGGAVAEADPIRLELCARRITAIAEEMGEVLKRTAISTNVKERLDYSCAVFDGEGRLVVNAPHIPVHLGSMGECVRQVRARFEDMRPGDVFVTNHPFRGGTHVPDVTVVTPVFAEGASVRRRSGEGLREAEGTFDEADMIGARRPTFFVASRAHHAEIGGKTPGSMPAWSRTLAEEGVVIDGLRLVRGGEMDEAGLRALLTSGAYPSRRVEENIADIRAQAAANRAGEARLLTYCQEAGTGHVMAYMGHIQRAAERKMRAAIGRLPAGRRKFTDRFDDGTPVCVSIEVAESSVSASGRSGEADEPIMTIDFGGTAGVQAGNLNANRAIVTSAVLYCLRCLIEEDVPLCEGVLSPVRIVLPECMLNPPMKDDPAQCAAVAAGNVETSQRVVDAVLGALGVAAASQGTMNNVVFGDETFGYYETIGGGSGAGADFEGADAVHTHMTNTRLTDPEVLEERYPVLLLECAIRRGSGGEGRRRGGDGMKRVMQFQRSLDVSLITQRRRRGPYGLNGGKDGKPGRNILIRATGERGSAWERIRGGACAGEAADGGIDLGAIAQFRVNRGDVLIVETPGGGGYGRAGPVVK